MKSLVLFGNGGHCKSCIEVIETSKEFKIKGIIVHPDNQIKKFMNYPVIGDDQNLKECFEKEDQALICVGQIKSPLMRIKLYELAIKSKFSLPTIISPNAYVSKHSKIGKGTVVMHRAIINSNSSIGNNCIINSCSLIEHDVKIGDNCHISTGVIINGQSQIGNETFLGSGSIIKNGVSISEKKIISFGSLVSEDL